LKQAVLDRLSAIDQLRQSARPRSVIENLCLDRQENDLRNIGHNGLVWDEDEAQAVVSFSKLLRHWKGEWAAKPFTPEPWQEHLILAPLFGWYRESDNGLRRRFNVGYQEVPRKNGKTTSAATLALQGLVADGEHGAEVYCTATTRDQASILFKDSTNMARQSPELSSWMRFWRYSITCDTLNSTLKPLSSDHDALHGLNIHRAVIDELHSHKTRDLWDVLQTSTGARRNPLLFAITTAGYDRASVCWEMREYARMVLEGHHKDDSFFAYVACAEAEDDPFDPATWAKANPNLDISINSDYLAREANKASTSPSYENTFRRLHLNQWTEQSVRWLPMHVWDDCAGIIDEEDLTGRECYAGLDLANTRDINALVLAFPFEGGRVKVLPVFWVPENAKDDRAEYDRRTIEAFISRDLIRATEGDTADVEGQIPDEIMEISGRFNILKLAYDPWGSGPSMVQKLAARGFPADRIMEFRQTVANFAAPTKELERLVHSRKLEHGANAVLRWMASNTAVKVDPSGNMRPDKSKSADKIDGIVALVMALGLKITEDVQANCFSGGVAL
jgi:phage terminase large subunit-like protein